MTGEQAWEASAVGGLRVSRSQRRLSSRHVIFSWVTCKSFLHQGTR